LYNVSRYHPHIPHAETDATQAQEASGDWPRPSALRVCYDCGLEFGSFTAVAAHAKKAHGYQSPAAPALHSTACLACLHEFHTRPRIIHHLLVGSRKCCDAVIANLAPNPAAAELLSSQERARAAEERKIPGRHLPRHRPMVRLPGPLPSWAPQV